MNDKLLSDTNVIVGQAVVGLKGGHGDIVLTCNH